MVDSSRPSLPPWTTVGSAIVGAVSARGSAVVEISGGSVLDDLNAEQQAIIRVHGTSFNLPFGTLSPNAGTLTGTLIDGSAIDTSFFRTPSATIELVPEPSEFFGGAVGLLALGMRRRPQGLRNRWHADSVVPS